jgi:hypothetical protein
MEPDEVQSGSTLRFPERDFQVWLFKPGHRQLLLRSTGDTRQYREQIDIAFKDVTYFALPTTFRGLVVRRADAEETPDDLLRGVPSLQPSSRIFIVEAGARSDVVIAQSMRHLSYDADFTAASPLVI